VFVAVEREGSVMQFFLHEIVARVVAAYLFINTIEALRHALAKRKLSFEQYGFVETLLNVPDSVTHRDTNPFRYWFLFGLEVFFLMACLMMVIFGWHVPNE
jgi:hypothetical protein